MDILLPGIQNTLKTHQNMFIKKKHAE